MKVNIPSFCRGQAATETMISLVVLVPMFLGIPMLGKYLDIKQKNIESSRYAAWERTIWSDNNGRGWSYDGVNRKTNDKIAEEIDHLFLGHPQHGVHQQDSASDNPAWVDHKGDELLMAVFPAPAPGDPLRAELDLYQDDIPVFSGAVGYVASKGFLNSGIPGLEQDIGSVVDVIDRTLSRVIPNCGIGGIQNGMAMSSDNFADINVLTQADNKLGDDDLRMRSGSGILSNVWAAPEEGEMRKRIDRLVLNEPVGCLTGFAKVTFGAFSLYSDGPPFGEIVKAHEVEAAVEPNALPAERIKR